MRCTNVKVCTDGTLKAAQHLIGLGTVVLELHSINS